MSQAEPVGLTEAEPAAPAGPQEPDTPDAGHERILELRELLLTRAGERHVVAIQDFPDPDAISSALAYREIAREYDIEAQILYEGMISHPENLALVNLLEIELTNYADAADLRRFNAAVFVDNQGTTTRLASRLKDADVPTLAVIDHHDRQELLDPVFRDVRPVAAAATIMADYLRSGSLLELDPMNPRHVNLATALMHGLHSETGGFIRARKPEYRAAAFLSNYLDPDLLEQVLCVQKSRGTMDVIQTALAKRTIRGGLSVAGVGYLRWSDRDAIPQAADFLLTEENVNTTVVYGIVTTEDERQVVSGSLRTTNATLGVDGFLKKSLGNDIRGRPFGGGRSRAGGFEIDVGFLTSIEEERETREAKWVLFDRQIRRKLFGASGLDSESEVERPDEDPAE